eukprot:5308673-Amphidinium_carterae.1
MNLHVRTIKKAEDWGIEILSSCWDERMTMWRLISLMTRCTPPVSDFIFCAPLESSPTFSAELDRSARRPLPATTFNDFASKGNKACF